MKKLLILLLILIVPLCNAEPIDIGFDIENTLPVIDNVEMQSEYITSSSNLFPIAEQEISLTAEFHDNNGFDTINKSSINFTMSNSTETIKTINSDSITTTINQSDEYGISGTSTVTFNLPSNLVSDTYTFKFTLTDESGTMVSSSTRADFKALNKFTVSKMDINAIIAGITTTGNFDLVMNYGEKGEKYSISKIETSNLIVSQNNKEVDLILSADVRKSFNEDEKNIGEPFNIKLHIDVPLGTASGNVSGTGTITIETNR